MNLGINDIKLKHDQIVVYTMPRSLSSFFCTHVSARLGVENFGEIFGQWRDREEIRDFLPKRNTLVKVQGEQYYLHKDLIDSSLLTNRSILILKPRSYIESYSSFILPMVMSTRCDFEGKNWAQYWNVSGTHIKGKGYKRASDVRNLYDNEVISKKEAIVAVEKYTEIARKFVSGMGHFARGNHHFIEIDDVLAMEENDSKSKIWNSPEEKFQYIDGWEDVKALIEEQGAPLWKRIESIS